MTNRRNFLGWLFAALILAGAPLVHSASITAPAGSTATGKVAWVDAVNGSNTTGAIGSLATPYLTIDAARDAAAAANNGTCVAVLPGTYNEQIVLTAGQYLYFYPGAVVNYTGSGGTFVASGTPGQVKIHGAGRFYHTGSQATAWVFETGTADLWHIDVDCEDVRTIAGISYAADAHGHLESVGAVEALEEDVATTTPARWASSFSPPTRATVTSRTAGRRATGRCSAPPPWW